MLAYTGHNIVGTVKPGFIGGASSVAGYSPNPTVGGPQFVGQAQDDMELRIQKQIALRDATELESQLKRPFPPAGSIRLGRHPRATPMTVLSLFNVGSPLTIGTANYQQDFGPGAHGQLCRRGTWLCSAWSTLNVPSGTKQVAYQGMGYTGVRKDFGPGFHDLHKVGWADANAPKSGVVMPTYDFDGMIDRATKLIGGLGSPKKGCLINQQNFKTFGVVQALYAFIDRLISSYFKGTPFEAYYNGKKRDVENKLLSDILANQKACAAPTPAEAAKEQAALKTKALTPTAVAPKVCPGGTFKAANNAVARAYRRAGYVESPPSCYGKPCPRGSFRAASTEEETAYTNAGMQQVIPGCWGRGAAVVPGRPGWRRRREERPRPRRRVSRRPKSYRGEYLRRRTVDPNVRLRVGLGPFGFVGGFVPPPSVHGYFDGSDGTVGGCGCGFDVEYDE